MADVLRFDIAKDPKGNPITYGRVGDTDGLTRSVKVFEDGKPLDLTGYVITFEGNTSKYKTKVFDTGGVSIVDAAKGEFNYTFPNMAFAVEGQYERAYFSFANADKRMTTADFQVIVFGNSDIDAEEAETIITEYNRLLAELHKKQDAYIEEMDQTFLSLTQQLEDLQAQIDDVVARLEAGDFYTKEESDGKFSTKTELSDHVDNKENPHGVTKSQVGLGDVSNYSVATEDEAKAGTADNKYMTPAKVKALIDMLMTVEESEDFTLLNGALKNGTLSAYKQFRLATIIVEVKNVQNETTCVKVPAGYEPISGYSFLARTNGNSGNNPMKMSIGADGIIKCVSNGNNTLSGSDQWITVNLTHITKS